MAYTRTGLQIITAALRKLAVIAEGQTPSNQNILDGLEALNVLVAQLKAIGMPLWNRETYLFTPTTSTYTIGPSQTLNTDKPIKLLQAVRVESNTKIEMEIISIYQYNNLPANSSGAPLKASYQPLISSGVLSIWPNPGSSNTASIQLTYQKEFDEFITAASAVDFPNEWYSTLIYKLAVSLAPEWGIPLQDRSALKQEAKEHEEMVLSMGAEDASLFIAPARRM